MRVTRRAGFTILEIIVAMALTLAVFAITLPFVRAQTRALGSSAGRLDADQLARYAQRAIDHDLRLASAVTGQPLIVQAGPMAISFNANLLASDTTDPGAADLQSGGATTLTESWRLSDAAALPRGGRTYPTQDYFDGDGGVSRNETVSYFLWPDTITGRSDIYVLYRRVNARDSVQVVRALHVPQDSAFFAYYRPIAGTLTRVAASRLPLYWDSTAVDSIRSVGVRAAGYFRDRTTGQETIRTVSWSVSLPNAAVRVVPACGTAPDAPQNLNVTKQTSSGVYRLELTWDDSPDDASGAGDVRYYVVERRLNATGQPWVTLATITASASTSYEWHHVQPEGNGEYEYAVRAVDCAAQTSTRATDGTVTLP